MQHRSRAYQTAINAVLANSDDGIPFDRLTNLVAEQIDRDRALEFRRTRLKRTPRETAAETIWKGQQGLARKYIDAAHRNGRITYLIRPNRQRLVFPGDPASTGGRHAKPRSWREEAATVDQQSAQAG